MHRTLRLLVGSLVTLVAFSAGADPRGIDSAELSLAIGALPPVVLQGNVGFTSINVSSGTGTFTEPQGAFGPTDIPLAQSLFTGVPQISGLTLAGFGNGTKLCTVPGPPLGCAGGLAGSSLVNILQLFNLSIPLSVVGAPGASTIAGAMGITITVKGQGWTAGVASVTGVTEELPGTTVTNTVTSAGSDGRTAGHGGTLRLVSGFQAITNVAGNLPGFGVQTFSFAPEPVELLLLGTGMAGFALYAGWRRRR